MVPPRPSRAHGGPTEVKPLLPQIPPRPIRKTNPSPDREAWARSPLNLPPSANSGLIRPRPSGNSADADAPRRPPSISFPSEVGQEGVEYTSYDQLPPDADEVQRASDVAPAEPEQTKNVSADVPLQQPKASHPQSTAKSRIAAVTRTDSTQAAAAGIGQARPDDDVHKTPSDSSTTLSRVASRTHGDDHPKRVPSTEPHPLRARSSFNRSASSLHGGTPRPPSLHSLEHHHDGIPEIGQQIPLYPNAGDVQAPSPAPGLSQHPPGIGFFNDGSARAHHRKRSSRHEFGPPGSYGLHGHGTEPHDQFEKQWIAKHPSEAAKENTPFLERPETALSSDQLNRIVSQSVDVGMGTSRELMGTPTQEIAFEASEQYASRIATPQASPAPGTEGRKRPSSGHQPPVESPLRNQNVPSHLHKAVESEDEDVIHIDPSSLRRGSKVMGGGGASDSTIDLGHMGANTAEVGGWSEDHGEGAPILASDELVKRPNSAFLQPAVDPDESHLVDEAYYDSDHAPRSRRSSLQPISHPSSRPGSTHGGYQGGPIHRFTSHDEHHGSGVGTPLEEIEEYEPLFPENEESERKKKTPKEQPNLLLHHFPSRDTWEDTPDSLKYQATVQTPEPPHERPVDAGAGQPAPVFETPEQEQMRRTHHNKTKADMTGDEKTLAKPHVQPGVHNELQADRPGVPRFPSRDVWEDTPESMRLVTTVSAPQMDETKSPPEDRPTTMALPGAQDDGDARSTTGFTQIMRPSIPARPERKSKLAQEFKPDVQPEADDRNPNAPDLGTNKLQTADRTKPVVPERPKPSIPARPARSTQPDHGEGTGATLSKTTSAGSAGSSDNLSPPVPKTKPTVPARPAGGKIAAMQATFMNDLNNRLKLGPQGPPPKVKDADADAETVEGAVTKEPLSDARKGRARGPPRRKPAVSAAATSPSPFSFSSPMTLFQIDEADELSVPPTTITGDDATVQLLEKEMAGNEARNTEEPTMLVKSKSISQEDAEAPDGHAADIVGGEDEHPPPISDTVNEEGKNAEDAEPIPAASAENAAETGKGFETAAVQSEQKDIEDATSPENGEVERI